MIFTREQLEHLWTHAGGIGKLAPTMAAIALAESDGGRRPYGDVYRGQGATSFGVWQIHTRDQNACLVNTQAGMHPYDEHRLVTDATYNARAAVAIERSQGLNAWSTYGHGHGSYLAFMSVHHAHRSPQAHHQKLQRNYRKVQITARTLHVRHHPLHAHEPSVHTVLQILGWQIIGAASFFFAWQMLRHLKAAATIAIREKITIIRRTRRRRRYREEAALRKRTMPRTRRRLALT